MFLASDLDEFRTLFSKKLNDMLSPDEIGPYILVLANSIQDEGLRESLKDDLRKNKKILQDGVEVSSLNATPDDIDVFNKIDNVDTDLISCWKKYQIGVWRVMSNPFRSLRPSRASRETIKSIRQAFNADTFNFNKVFLKPEILWEGEWQSNSGKSVNFRVLYNKFPFIPYHLLIVPDPELQQAQYLTKHYHEMIWNLVADVNHHLPGFGMGYNSMGACASVNHLHFHGFVEEDRFPIELDRWSHNGGAVDYPMSCTFLGDIQQAWGVIAAMHKKDEPYNVLYLPGRCYVLPRQPQGSEEVNAAVSGAGWIEECGVFVEASNAEIERLTEDIITDNLKSLSV